MPNYFGYQRFGIEKNNFQKGKEVLEGKLKVRNKSLKKMYINAYQSLLFNNWLSKRVQFSKIINGFNENEIKLQYPNISSSIIKELKTQKHFFKILPGDLIHHYPYGKLFYATNLKDEADKFFAQDRVPKDY